QSVINEINGKKADGTGTVAVPTLFGFNMNAVSAAQKYKQAGGANAITTKGNNPTEIIRAVFQTLLAHTNARVGKVVTALKNNGLLNSTLIILNAKHGQTPRVGAARYVDDTTAGTPFGDLLNVKTDFDPNTAHDSQAMLWLNPGFSAATAQNDIQTA